jgi:hypothetical protein
MRVAQFSAHGHCVGISGLHICSGAAHGKTSLVDAAKFDWPVIIFSCYKYLYIIK